MTLLGFPNGPYGIKGGALDVARAARRYSCVASPTAVDQMVATVEEQYFPSAIMTRVGKNEACSKETPN